MIIVALAKLKLFITPTMISTIVLLGVENLSIHTQGVYQLSELCGVYQAEELLPSLFEQSAHAKAAPERAEVLNLPGQDVCPHMARTRIQDPFYKVGMFAARNLPGQFDVEVPCKVHMLGQVTYKSPQYCPIQIFSIDFDST